MQAEADQTLGRLITLDRGMSWEASQEREQSERGVFPVLRIPNIQDHLVLDDLLRIRVFGGIPAERYRATLGTILMVASNGNPKRVGNAVFIDEDAGFLFASFLMAARIREGVEAHPKFVYHLIESPQVQDLITRSVQGSTGLKNLSEATITGIRVPRLSFAEQRRIAEILDTLDVAIRKTEQVIAKLQQMKQGLLNDLLTRGIDEHSQLRDPIAHSEQFKDSPLGRIPKEWEVCGIDHYLVERDGLKPGPFGSSITKSMYTTSGYRVYGQEQVIAGRLDVGDYYISSSRYNELNVFAVAEHDILISLVGTVGRALVVREPFEPGIINPRLMRLRPCLGTTDVEFLKYVVTSPIMRRQLERFATGGTMPVLNGTIVRKVRLPLIPRQEQSHIAKVLDEIAVKCEHEIEGLAKLHSLKQGLMDDLLTGLVRVNV